MKRFVPIRAEGALVLGLVAVIAGSTFAINELSAPTVTTKTMYGTPTVRIKQVEEKGGVKPGPVQPRVIQQPIVAAPIDPGFAPAPAPVAPTRRKKTLVATTPAPVVATPEPAVEEPGGGLPPGPETGKEPGTGTGNEPGTGTGTGKEPEPPAGGTPPGNGCLLAPLCAPGQPGEKPSTRPSALPDALVLP